MINIKYPFYIKPQNMEDFLDIKKGKEKKEYFPDPSTLLCPNLKEKTPLSVYLSSNNAVKIESYMNYFLLFFSIINKLFSCEDKVYTFYFLFYFLLFSFFENTKYFNTHTHTRREGRRF